MTRSAWAPIVKFGADEQCFPNSVDWFLRADLVDGHGTVQASPARANPGAIVDAPPEDKEDWNLVIHDDGPRAGCNPAGQLQPGDLCAYAWSRPVPKTSPQQYDHLAYYFSYHPRGRRIFSGPAGEPRARTRRIRCLFAVAHLVAPGRSQMRQFPRSLPSGTGSPRTARRQRLQTTEPVPPMFGRPRTHSQRSTMLDLNRHGLTTCGKTAAALSATVLLCLLGAATAQAVPTITKTAIPLQATGYRYQQVGSGLGAGFEATAFDDSAWSTGQAAFGTSDGPCAVNQSPPVHTLWSVNTDLLVRKSFTLPSTASAVHVLGTVDNAATVYLNGKEIGFTSTGFCTQDTIDFAAPDAVAGTNVLAVRAHDDGVASYLDQSVTYEVPTYSLCLLYDPTKSAKLGSTIPLKFQLCDADGTNLSSPTVTVHATGVAKQDDTASATAEDAGNANPDADFRYDPDLAGYIFNKTTKGLTTGTWMLTFTVGGDSEPNYYLSFDVR